MLGVSQIFTQESVLAPPQSRLGWPILIARAAVLIGSCVGWSYVAKTGAADAVAAETKSTVEQGISAPIPVTVAGVQRTDFPVYLNGLGTVQPFNTVTVRSRVTAKS
jgi:multidrug efflux system membrane fusion protein